MEEFEQAQIQLGKKTKTAPRPKRKTFLYTGMFVCEDCGCAIVGEHKIKKTSVATHEYTYYHCSHRRDHTHKQCVYRKSVQEKDIDEQFLHILNSIQLHDDFIIWAKEIIANEEECVYIEQERQKMRIQKEYEKER